MGIITKFISRHISELRGSTDLLKQKEESAIRRDLALHIAKAVPWKINGNRLTYYEQESGRWKIAYNLVINDLKRRIRKEDHYVYHILRKHGQASGYNRLRMYAAFDSLGIDWHWYEIKFYSDENNVKNHTLTGISSMIDSLIEEEHQLNEWQKEINKADVNQSYLCNISHDIRTPLNAVTGFSQLITSDELCSSKEELEQYNICIRENAQMMLEMINSVMTRSHVNAEELVLRPLHTSAAKFIRNAYNTHLILIPSHLKLIIETEPDDRLVDIDPGHTRQVMNNFLSNAFKFTKRGSITIGWRFLADEGNVLFYCRDTGIGINNDKLKHIFDRYYKVDEGDRGTGLGLQISKNIIEQQGGEIGCDSTLGRGSEFWFKFKAINE